MELNRIIQQIHIITHDVIKNAESLCFNKFSTRIFYVAISTKELKSCNNSNERQKRMFYFLINKKLLNINEISLEIEKQQNNISWIDMELFHTSVVTVIMTIFVPKEQEGSHENLQFHSCFSIPPWTDESFNTTHIKGNICKKIKWNLNHKIYLKQGKFDLNWQHQDYLSKWKLFLWKRRCFILK